MVDVLRTPGGVGNLTCKVIGTGQRKRLIMTVDLSKNLGLSNSKKSLVIATTGGNKKIPDHPNLMMNLNIYMPAD